VAEQPGLSFAGLLRQLRAEARLTQEELAEAASLSPRSVSDLERGINHTARKDTAVLLAGALGLAGPAGELFVAAARGRAPAAEALAAVRSPGPQGLAVASPYRGLNVFGEQDAAFFFGRETAAAVLLDRMSQLSGGPGLLVVSGVSGAGKSSLLRAGVLPRIREAGLASAPGAASWPCLVFTPPARRRTNWRCGWQCWRRPTLRRCGGDWRPPRPGSRSPCGRPPWPGPGRRGT
jgi:transcriptional regulator with XRE-family HTH domain